MFLKNELIFSASQKAEKLFLPLFNNLKIKFSVPCLYH